MPAGNGPTAVTTRIYLTALDSDAQLPGALTREEVDADPDQASPAAFDANYGKEVETRARRHEDDLEHRCDQRARRGRVV